MYNHLLVYAMSSNLVNRNEEVENSKWLAGEHCIGLNPIRIFFQPIILLVHSYASLYADRVADAGWQL